MFASLLGLIPRAATQALIALVVTGSAIGVSAAAGGPNLPQQALQAVGFAGERAGDNAQGSADVKAVKAARASATAGAQATISATPGESSLAGLCNAYARGGLGQNAQAKGRGTPAAGPMERLTTAAKVSETADATAKAAAINAYCATLSRGESPQSSLTSTAEAESSGRSGGPRESSTAAATPKGRAADAPGKAR